MKKNLMKYKKVLIPMILIIIILIGIIIYASNNFGNNYYYTLPQPDPGLIFVKLLDVSDNKIRKVTNKKFEKIYRINQSIVADFLKTILWFLCSAIL